MTKGTGIGRGGRRPGGRPPGSKNKKTVLAELLPRLAADDQELPLYGLLRRIADPELLDERYKDLRRIATLPYLHAKPRSDLTAKAPFQMTDAELIAVREAEEEHQRQLKRGKSVLQVIRGRQ
jgi:hypothetical protein